MPPRLAVCSWSLQPTSPDDLASKLRECGVANVQIALDPIRTGTWNLDDFRRAMTKAGITVVSGMMAMKAEDYSTLESIRRTGGVRPDADWPDNLAAAGADARLARELGLALVTFHAGFIPEADGTERRTILDRVRAIVDVFAREGVRVALETGQETAECLEHALTALGRPTVGVNFDPANMILYGMGNPVEALARLAPWIRQIHVKDAVATGTPGTWGEEVPVGSGAVDWHAFFDVARRKSLGVDLAIEREAGSQRITDIRTARRLVESTWTV